MPKAIEIRLLCTGINEEMDNPARASFSRPKGAPGYSYFSLEIDDETKAFLEVGKEYTFTVQEAGTIPSVVGGLPKYTPKPEA